LSLKERISTDYVKAYKAKEQLEVDTLRLLKAAIKNEELKANQDLTDDDLIKVISTEIKKRKQAIESYEQADRKELADKEKQEILVLEKYLPQQLSAEELEVLVKETIAEVGAESAKDMGRVMKTLMQKVRGAADGKTVNELVRKLLD